MGAVDKRGAVDLGDCWGGIGGDVWPIARWIEWQRQEQAGIGGDAGVFHLTLDI